MIANAGGLDPSACAQACAQALAEAGCRSLKIAVITGDDVLERLWHETDDEERLLFGHLDTKAPLAGIRDQLVTANAYLGAWGIVDALQRGADIVITGRVTDAAVVVGPAAWHFGWKRTDWDALAGAVVAGHLIECGPQVTGGNYAFFEEVRSRTARDADRLYEEVQLPVVRKEYTVTPSAKRSE